MSGPHLTEQQRRAWRTHTLATLMHPPRWGQPAVGTSLRYGQAYGTPLFFGVTEETGEGYFGDRADEWSKAREAEAKRSEHPNSPVFRNNPPK
jgi:hypothetical protein